MSRVEFMNEKSSRNPSKAQSGVKTLERFPETLEGFPFSTYFWSSSQVANVEPLTLLATILMLSPSLDFLGRFSVKNA